MNKIDKITGHLRYLMPRFSEQRGNTMAYIAMMLIIFGVIGAVMASLLTSSITSTASPNHSRRALYMTEAGMRYALGNLRNSEDWTDNIQTLNSTTYTVSAGETFTLNIFSPWYQSGLYQSKSAGDDLALEVPEGEMPEDYTIDTSAPYLSIVNYNYTASELKSDTCDASCAEIQGFNRLGPNTLELTVRDNFTVDRDELVCLAATIDLESTLNPINSGDTLYVAEQARHVFPPYDGAVEINRSVYFYDELYHDQANGRVELRNITGRPDSDFPYNADVKDYAILSPRNHIIIATGTSETITAGGNLNEAVFAADRTEHDVSIPPPDIDADEFTDNISEVEGAITGFISVDTNADELNIGGGYTPPATTAFGAAWYDADKAIGGDNNFCQAGACRYLLGFRTFFTLTYSGNGDGLTFSVINSGNNDAFSVGGDIELSELLAYAGDSRTNVEGTAWLDGSGDGLRPPKMAVEFDTITNFDAGFESTLPRNYCLDASSLKSDTRNDPLSSDRDAVQYVYWGDTALAIPCRNNDPSYDDNRHNAEGDHAPGWPTPFAANGQVRSKPLIGPNDTLYVVTDDGHLHAIDIIDGTEKWTFPDDDPLVVFIGDVFTNPAINDSGDTIYVAARNGSDRNLWAVNASDGTSKWDFPNSDPAVSTIYRTDESSPAVDRNGVIYIGSDVNSISGKIFAINPDGTQKWVFDTAEDAEGDVIVDRSGGALDGTIYVGVDGGEVLAFAPASTGLPKWSFPTGPDIETAPALSPDGSIVYALGENGTLYAINASDGSPAWGSPPATSGTYHDSNPVVDTSGGPYDGTIYIMNSDEAGLEGAHLSSVKADGSGFNWERVPIKEAAAPAPEHSKSSPAVGPDGTIYVGSDDDHLYAINPSDGSIKWRMDLGRNVRSSPTVDSNNGTIYVGNDNEEVFAFSPYALPRNSKDLYITSVLEAGSPKVGGEIVDLANLDDWLKGDSLRGPWAVRIEVKRRLLPDFFGNFDYTLRTWMRQCAELDCSDVIGTFYQDTRARYEAKAPHLEQTVELSLTEQALFDRFLFGFTGATAMGASQNAVIGDFQLSFRRLGDPVILVDPDWP